ncbi:MAG: hypothetical protein PUF35_01865 [Subdoligranulum sp.]|nr:hypothetical protein [Subdoligranulum sp.]MDD6520812.1 hypothetical protein [Subdoligranulum sp.]
MLDKTSSIICAFGLASAAPRSPYRHLELCGIAQRNRGYYAIQSSGTGSGWHTDQQCQSHYPTHQSCPAGSGGPRRAHCAGQRPPHRGH